MYFGGFFEMVGEFPKYQQAFGRLWLDHDRTPKMAHKELRLQSSGYCEPLQYNLSIQLNTLPGKNA